MAQRLEGPGLFEDSDMAAVVVEKRGWRHTENAQRPAVR